MWGVNSVYRNTLGWNKEQANIVGKLNEVIEAYNKLPKYVQDAIDEALSNLPSGNSDHTQLTNRDAADQHPQSAITGLVAALAAKYALPIGGIPSSDMATAVQTSLGKADTAYQKPVNGIPETDLDTAVQTSLGKADSALQAVPDLSSTYVTVAQGAANSGKFLVVNSSGNVALVTLTEWQGGSY